MTIRSGGGARDKSQAHPAERGTPGEEWQPQYDAETHGAANPFGPTGGASASAWQPERRRRGIPGFLKFLIFAVILASLVLATLVTILRPLVRNTVVGWATSNPAALSVPFIADLVREDLGSKLTDPASNVTTQVAFQVADGSTASTIAAKLQDQGFLTDSRAFVFLATERGLTGSLQSGSFILRKSMTPDQLVTALLAPDQIHYVEIRLRTGLRLEQITAKLETLPELQMNPGDFYALAKHPTPELLNDYPWLKGVLPPGASLEGFLWPATYRVLPDTTAQELIRDMLDNFQEQIGDRMNVPAARGLSFYQVLALASLVEREAVHDSDRPKIAGVFTDRLDPQMFPNGHLGSDPTVFYIHDTLELDPADLPAWTKYVFWDQLPPGYQLPAVLPDDLAGYNTYTHTGLIPGPICTPTLKSIDAALNPDTKDHYLYFLAKADGSGDIVYAKTLKDHQANIRKYGPK